VQPELVLGTAELALEERARTLQPLLVAVGSLGRRGLSDWLLGSTAERVVHLSEAPTLVVRQPERLLAWLRGDRPLRAMLAVSQDGAVAPAKAWLEQLAVAGPIQVLAVEVSGGADLGDDWFVAETARLASHIGLPPTDCRIEVRQWEIHEHILRCAEREGIDLLVMGAHLHPGTEPPVSARTPLAVVRHASIAVAVVPHR
jgi:nucleotide-binding universal stress UspA family protein